MWQKTLPRRIRREGEGGGGVMRVTGSDGASWHRFRSQNRPRSGLQSPCMVSVTGSVGIRFWWRYTTTGAVLLENNEAYAKLTTANGGTFTWAQLDLVANHVTARSIGDWRALTWLATATGWTRRKRSAICSGKLISVHMIWYDVNGRYGI